MAEITTHEDKDGVVEVYELGYHLVPSLGENDLALRVGELQKAVSRGGTIISEAYPEHTTLAYTMRKMVGGKWEKFDTAFFGWIKFDAATSDMPQLKKELDLNEAILRYLLVKTVREDTFVPYALRKRDEIVNEPVGEVLVRKTEAPETPGEKPDEALLDKHIDELVS